MPKVFITQENNKLNFTPAYTYGELSFVTNSEYSYIKNSKSNFSIHKEIAKTTIDFNPDEDYLLLCGDPIIIGLTVHSILSEYGRLTLLKWQNQDKMYTPILLNHQPLANE